LNLEEQTPEKDFVQNFKDKLFYDFGEIVSKIKGSEKEVMAEEPFPYQLWCHLTCVYWLPELYFDDLDTCETVKGIIFLNKRRF